MLGLKVTHPPVNLFFILQMRKLRPREGKRPKALAGSYWNSNNPSLTKSRVCYREGH